MNRRRQHAFDTVAGQEEKMRTSTNRVVVGLDNGGKVNNATVLETSGRFLVDGLIESPSLVREGPDIAIDALARTFDDVLALTGAAKAAVLAVGLDTPGPASAEGVVSSRGSTNFSHPAWRSFDIRSGLEERLQLPVIYNNDGNAAALLPTICTLGLRAVSTLRSQQ
jgi:glucokinase